MTTTPSSNDTFAFQAEVHQLLDLVIHSLYTHKEVFLRELISNASDALDKLRFSSLTEPDLMKDGAPLEIRIVPDAEAGTLTIEDRGIGMTRDELIQNLGTIAHSGTKAFLEAAKKAGSDKVQLIGQFGVGFYSAFLVADRVSVTSRSPRSTEAYEWTSDAVSSFRVVPSDRKERGTAVVLHLKPDAKHFLEEWSLKELVRRYSDFVSYPIQLRVRGKTKPSEDASNPSPSFDFETVNRASALWQRAKSEISEDQYTDFYRHLTHDGEPPLARTHFTVEGTQVFTSLLYVPSKAPLFEPEPEKRGVRLFVKRVFIMDDCRDLLPPWLRFVRGVVDSDDLPLNVSRETLQDSQVVRTIRKQLVKKVLDLLEELAQSSPEKYATFWGAFGVAIKEGAATEWDHRERLAKLLRYPTSKGEGPISLETYVARMPLRQKAIYYVCGESEAALATSPYIESLSKQGFEVLFLTHAVDEWVMDTLREFDKRPLVSAMRAGLDVEPEADEKKAQEQAETAVEPLLAWMKEVLGERVADVKTSHRLTDSPCCLVVPQGEHHAYLEQLLKAHGRAAGAGKRILEINAEHPLIRTMTLRLSKGDDKAMLSDWVELLYDQALLTEGSRIEDPNRFARRLTTLLQAAALDARTP